VKKIDLIENPCNRYSVVVTSTSGVAEVAPYIYSTERNRNNNLPARVGQTITGSANKEVAMAAIRSAPFDLSAHASTAEFVVVLVNASRFDRLLRKDDFFDEGVAAVFGISGAEAELLSLTFHAGKFTSAQVATWLAERRFTPPADVPNRNRPSRS
jgi:hypothetical protein